MLNKIYTWDKQKCYDVILKHYAEQGRCVVSFLYFANMMRWRVIENKPQRSSEKLAIRKSYIRALDHADFLLPDGIALQVFYRCAVTWSNRLHNLNGTDFVPYVLDRLMTWWKKVHLCIYAVYDASLGKSEQQNMYAKTYIQERWWDDVEVLLLQSPYSEKESGMDRDAYTASLEETDTDVRLFLMCTWSPHQEVRVDRHRQQFLSLWILVFNAWWLVDFWSGFETRAPNRVVKARVLETPWRILQHPKKNLKKLLWMFGVVRYLWRKICK